MRKHPALRHSSLLICDFPRGFTLLELLVICLILAVLALTLGPALARSSSGSRTLQCMNNHRQLCATWRMFADDNNDRIVYSSDDGQGTSPYQPRVANSIANNNAWTWSKMDFYSGNPYNWDPAADTTLRPLWPYTGQDTNLFKCPSDRSYIVASSQTKPRIRSISMNFYLGAFAGSALGSPVPGVDKYQVYLKILNVSLPNKIFVFLDHRADSINWGNFTTDMTGYSTNPGAYRFGTFPGFYHDQSCTFSFVDGHVEEKRWLDARTTPPRADLDSENYPVPVPYNPDVAWLQDHATRPK